MRSPLFADSCANPHQVRVFTILKLLLLLLLIAAAVVLPAATIEPPSLELPQIEVLALPEVGGRGTSGSRVELLSNNQRLGFADVADNGRWQLVPDAPFNPGIHLLVAQAVDDEGQVIASGPEGEGRLIVLGLPTLEVAAAEPEDNQVELSLFGTGTAASVLQLVHNQTPLEPTIVDDQGNWTTTLSVAIPSENEFYVQVLASDDSILGRSASKNFDILATTETEPEPEDGPAAGLTVDSVRYDDAIRSETLGFIAGWLDVAGSGRPGRVIEIQREGQPAGQPATVQPDGSWTLRFFVVLLPGEQTFTGRMLEADGQVVGERSFIVTIPAPPSLAVEGGLTDLEDVILTGRARPNRPIVLTINSETIATVQSDDQGVWQHSTRLEPGEYEFVALDGLLDSERGQLSVALAVPVIIGQSTDESGELIPGFYGRGRPNTRLEILQAETPVGQATVDSEGDWRCQCTLPPGEHTLSVREIDEPHRASQPAPIQVLNPTPAYVPGPADPDAPPFSCPADSPPGQIVGTIYIVGCGESLSTITGRLGVTADQLLAYNPQLSDPARFYVGQHLNIPQAAACFDDPA